jgi:tRNA pseudouridine55 synthase
MHKILSIYKPSGLTPLEIIKQIKKQKPELAHVPITYAGRLDPLAHGVLLLLVGEEAKKRTEYLSLPKSYEFEVVFGLKTDTYDLLGHVTNYNLKKPTNVNLFVNTFVNKHIGKQKQSYPPYSSKPVMGKPLFWWAKNNRLNEIEIPEKEIEIYSFAYISNGEITIHSLKQKVGKAIASVHGDFRQNEIKNRWDEVFSKIKNEKKRLTTAKFSISCSSGTYVRELVHQLGQQTGFGAVSVDIVRTSVGMYTIKKAVKI